MRTAEAKPVLAGAKVKWTLEQIEQSNPGRVRLDWLRFTVPLDAVIEYEPGLQDLTPLDLLDQPARDLVRMATTVEDHRYTTPRAVARAGAAQLVQMLDCGIEVGPVEDKGMDFYTARASLMFEGACVGQVLAGGKETNQSSTVHVNLHGAALLLISSEALKRIHGFVSQAKGWLTRVDLSLDVWSGHRVEDVEAAYLRGEFDVRGKRPGQRHHGSWTLGHSRTYEVGSRATGKMFRGYEKGHQLFGTEVAAEWASGKKALPESLASDVGSWVRYEVELRSNHRVLELDLLTRPADFFAGAYDFCARVLEELDVKAQAQRILTVPELKDATAQAATARVLRYCINTAGPAIVALFDLGTENLLADVIESQRHRLPRRLKGFSLDSVRAAFAKVAQAMAPACSPSFIGAA